MQVTENGKRKELNFELNQVSDEAYFKRGRGMDFPQLYD